MCLIYVIQKANMDSMFRFRSAKPLYALRSKAMSEANFVLTIALVLALIIVLVIVIVPCLFALANLKASACPFASVFAWNLYYFVKLEKRLDNFNAACFYGIRLT